MKAFVTGAAGFLGSFLSDQLLEQGYAVVGVDNFFRGKKEYLPTHKHFTFYELDLVTHPDELKKTIIKEKPEVMYHYAAINGTKYFYDIPHKVLNDNVSITQNVLNACHKSSVKKIVYASSSEVYGEPMQVPTPETHPILLNIHTVRDSYASSKALGEFFIKLYAIQHHLDYLIFRIFNTYGPRMDTSEYGQVIPEFIKKAYAPEPFTIIGNGAHTRSFCYVKDHTRLAVSLAEHISNQVVNLGNDNETTIDNLAQTIHTIVGRPFKPTYLPPREYDHKRRCPDITLLKKLINDYPKTSLKDGIQQTVAAYKKPSSSQKH